MKYIGQDLFVDMEHLTLADLTAMIDSAVEKGQHPEAQAAAVEQLRQLEQKNVDAARELLAKQ